MLLEKYIGKRCLFEVDPIRGVSIITGENVFDRLCTYQGIISEISDSHVTVLQTIAFSSSQKNTGPLSLFDLITKSMYQLLHKKDSYASSWQKSYLDWIRYGVKEKITYFQQRVLENVKTDNVGDIIFHIDTVNRVILMNVIIQRQKTRRDAEPRSASKSIQGGGKCKRKLN
jgi:hypothetical protein